MSADDNVRPLQLIQCRGDRPAPLSDAELVRLRAMLEGFDKIVYGCPIARSVIADD